MATSPIRTDPAAPMLRWLLLAGVLLGTAIALFSPTLFNDGDTLWHVRAGEWMLSHRSILTTDPFTSTAAGQPWTTHEWLAEVLTALAWGVMGATGIALLHALAVAVTLSIVARALSDIRSQVWAAIAMLLTLGCLAPGLLARPHVLMWPLVALWTDGLLTARREARAPSWWLLLVMLVWANLHGSWAFGLALIAGFAFEALVTDAARWRTTLVSWSLFAGAAIAAAACTPHGVRGLLFPFALLQIQELATIREWAPLAWDSLQPAHLALLSVAVVTVAPSTRPPWTRIVLLLGLCWLTVQHQRHQMLLGIVGVLVIADQLRQRSAVSTPPSVTRARWPAWRLVIASVALTACVRIAVGPRTIPPRATHAVGAIAAMPAHVRAQAGLNDYAFGGALIFAGVRPFVDGRADLFGDAFLRTYDAMVAGNEPALDAAIVRYELQWALLQPGQGAIARLQARGWREAYRDTDAVLLLRGGR